MTRLEEILEEQLAPIANAIDNSIRVQALTSALDDLMASQAAFESDLRRIKGAVKEALSAIDAMDPVGARIILKGALR